MKRTGIGFGKGFVIVTVAILAIMLIAGKVTFRNDGTSSILGKITGKEQVELKKESKKLGAVHEMWNERKYVVFYEDNTWYGFTTLEEVAEDLTVQTGDTYCVLDGKLLKIENGKAIEEEIIHNRIDTTK